MKGICGRTCGCPELCPSGEAKAEEAMSGDYDFDGSMADAAADRYERWLERDA